MTEQLSLSQALLLIAYAVGMTAGQVLFKMAAVGSGGDAADGPERLFGLWHNAYFIAALGLYAGLAVLWVWILGFTPLSRAYPFVALAFALTPLLGGILFAEPISPRLLLGVGIVVAGLFLVMG
jgi:drug/metabolite transporter (DMT)-like permease